MVGPAKGLARGIAVVVILAVVGGGCSAASQPSASGRTPPEELRIAVASLGNEALDPLKSPNLNGRYLRLMFDHLVGVDSSGENVSKETGVARDWTISSDGRTYDFVLRDGIKFHNGDELTSEDVRFSLDRLKGPGVATSLGGEIAKLIDTVTVRGKYEISITLKSPNPTFLIALSPLEDLSSLIVPAKYFQSVGPDGFAERPVGSGPYKLVDRQVGAFIKLEQAFPEHFAIGKPRFKRVTFRLVPEESTRLAMLKSGEADFVDVGIDKAASLQTAGFHVFQHGLRDALLLLFQMQRPTEATRDVNVRKALSYAINRQELNQFVMGGLAEVTGNAFIGQVGGTALSADPYDPAKAKEYLDKTSFGNGGKTLTIQLQAQPRDGWPQMLSIAQALQGYWKKVGIETTITYRDYGAYRAEWGNGTLPAPAVTVLNYAAKVDFSTASNVFGCKGVLTTACDPKLDALFASWVSAGSQSEYEKDASVTESYMRDNYIYIGILAAGLIFAGDDAIPANYRPGRIALGWNVQPMVKQ